MRFFNMFNELCSKVTSIFNINSYCRNQDKVHLILDGLDVKMNRCFNYDIPHEVSIFIPRAEIRKKIKNGDRVEETEIILNSITVVHSPQRPSNKEDDSLAKPPEPPKNEIIIK